MQTIESFELLPIASNLPQSELLWRGVPCGLKVDGVIIEKQYRLAAGFLLFLTEDSPYEEGLHIYLLNPERQLLDAVELSSPYASAILKDVTSISETAVTFSFFGGDQWQLEVRPTPRLALAPSLFSPVKFKTGLLSQRRLTLRRLK